MTDLVLRVVGQGGYLGIALLMALENIFPPIPSEVIMGTGGILVAHGRMRFWLLVAAGTLGSTAGNYVWYWAGRRFGLARLRPFVERHGRWLTLRWGDVERIDRFFARHGDWLIFAARFSPAFRTLISLPAGLVAMPRWRFLVWTAAGTTVWNVFLAGAGLYLGTRFHAAEAWVGPATAVLVGAIALGYLYRVVTWRD